MASAEYPDVVFGQDGNRVTMTVDGVEVPDLSLLADCVSVQYRGFGFDPYPWVTIKFRASRVRMPDLWELP